MQAIEEGLCAGDTANCPDGDKFRQTFLAFVLCELGVRVSAGSRGERLSGAGRGEMGVEFRGSTEGKCSVVRSPDLGLETGVVGTLAGRDLLEDRVHESTCFSILLKIPVREMGR